MEGLLPGQRERWDRGFGFGPLTPAINADLAAAGLPEQAQFDPDFVSVLRGPDRTPDAAGQWGAALAISPRI